MSQKYSHLKIRLASPEEIRSWSHGEVKKHETINYRTLKPEKDGLFCEVIFGPTKDYQCACSNKSKRTSSNGKKCSVCGVEITESKVRRERMGHIELAAPVVHAWFLRNTPSRLAILLDIKSKDLEEVVYLASYIVVEPGDTPLLYKQILSEFEYSEAYYEYGNRFRALTGAEAVKYLLKKLDLKKEANQLRSELKTASKQRRDKVIKRLAVVEAFKNSDNKPEWMVLEVLPVIPPDLRPMVQLDGGRFATTDLNDLYRRILNRNNRLKKQFEQNAPHLITKNEKRMLQEAVDALIDNSKRGKKAVVEKNRPLKSLSDMLRGKQGRFRQNLLGKRVDYSGRSVIVVGPDLEMYQCGIPKEMAIILFKPFVIRELIRKNITSNIRSAKKMIDVLDDRIWAVLEDCIREHPVLLNRAPTLHRLGIQAFEPKLVEGKAIRLHPLVTTAFNADFDGDQMAVHVPLSEEAQAEARVMMLASNNILNPKDGKPVVTPTQDMVLGNYYLTQEKEGDKGEGNIYRDFNEATIAYENKEITLHTRIVIPAYAIKQHSNYNDKKCYVVTTYGKIIFNRILPDEFPFVNEPTTDNLTKELPLKYYLPKGCNVKEGVKYLVDFETGKLTDKKREIVTPFKKSFLGKIIAEIFARYKINETSKMLDKIKNLGFYYSTISGITISANDVTVYKNKAEVIKEAEATIERLDELYDMGLITKDERYKMVTDKIWPKAKKDIEDGLVKELEQNKDNHIYMMQDSGARGSASNFSQLAGMRGLMANTKGKAIELPIKSCFREGLTMSEFFISTHGSRKGSTDTALKTADSGYLTRRLVDVSQEVVITEDDCHTDRGVVVSEFKSKDRNRPNDPIERLKERIIGRYASCQLIDPNTGEIILEKNTYITEEIADRIEKAGIEEVGIRTVLTCNSKTGLCKKCYGRNLATGGITEVGESVGTIAAQSIGEPGTQLTMRTFHTGGVAGADIVQGLPRVQELFESRAPKGEAIITEISGKVTKKEPADAGGTLIVVTDSKETKEYLIPRGREILVNIDDEVHAGDQLTDGSIDLKKLLRVTDVETVQQYILKEVQSVYRSQGVEISDKHIEIIARQMTRKILVDLEGDTDLLPGSIISINDFTDANKKAFKERKRPAVAHPIILGITKAALKSDSLLSSASFQETTRVLTDAAIKGKIDPLIGLKENVIIGGLIPAGTGILKDKTFDYEMEENDEDDEDFADYNL